MRQLMRRSAPRGNKQMGSYVPSTRQERAQMLQKIGADSIDALFANVPAG